MEQIAILMLVSVLEIAEQMFQPISIAIAFATAFFVSSRVGAVLVPIALFLVNNVSYEIPPRLTGIEPLNLVCQCIAGLCLFIAFRKIMVLANKRLKKGN